MNDKWHLKMCKRIQRICTQFREHLLCLYKKKPNTFGGLNGKVISNFNLSMSIIISNVFLLRSSSLRLLFTVTPAWIICYKHQIPISSWQKREMQDRQILKVKCADEKSYFLSLTLAKMYWHRQMPFDTWFAFQLQWAHQVLKFQVSFRSG